MDKIPLHSTMIRFALQDSLLESTERYKQNAQKLTAFERSINDGSHKRIGAVRLTQKSQEISSIFEDQDGLKITIPQLDKTNTAFKDLSEEEKALLNKRLEAGAKKYQLTLKDRSTGQLLATAA